MDLDGFCKFCLIPVSARPHFDPFGFAQGKTFAQGSSGRALPFCSCFPGFLIKFRSVNFCLSLLHVTCPQ